MSEPPNTRSKRLFQPQPGRNTTILNWNADAICEFSRYAQAFHEAARTLIATVDMDESPRTDWNACPVVFLYRHAAELYLKGLVLGNGANFLHAPPAQAGILHKHSLKQLLPFVREMFQAAGWSEDTGNEMIKTLAELEDAIRELDDVDPGHAFRYPVRTDGRASVKRHFNFSVREFVSRMDAVLEVLDTADFGLAALWDQRADAIATVAASRET